MRIRFLGGGESPPPASIRCRDGETLLPLLERAHEGNREALATLCRHAREQLLQLVGRKLAGGWSGAWAEDVVQDCLVDLLRGYPACRARSEAELHAWIDAIGRRGIASLFREEGARAGLTAPLAEAASVSLPGEEPLPEHHRALAALLQSQLRSLPEACHRLLWVRVQWSATWTEVGAELGIAPSAAKRRFQRLRDRLRAAELSPRV